MEKRIKAYVLTAGTGSFTDVAVLNMPALKEQALEEFSLQDSFYAQEKFVEYAKAGSEPKLVKC